MFRDRRAVVLDIEGVLFAGEEALPGGREVIEALARRGIPCRLLTNNSFRTGAEMGAHMRAIGIPAEDGAIVNALDHAGAGLGRMGAEGPVLLVGGAALRAPLEGNGFQLGTGAIAAAVTAAGGRAPEPLGKPAPYLFEEVLDQLGVRPGEAVMVGDSLRADIAGAKGVGMAVVWVNRWGRLEGDPDVQPDLEIRRVDEILPHLPEGMT